VYSDITKLTPLDRGFLGLRPEVIEAEIQELDRLGVLPLVPLTERVKAFKRCLCALKAEAEE
jgi:hypothetical protein